MGDPIWKWVNDNPNSLGDAEIIFQKPMSLEPKPLMKDYISNISESLTIKYRGPHSVSASPTWTLTYPLAASLASATTPTTQRFTIGLPNNLVRYFALVQRMNFWLVPRHGKGKFGLGYHDCQSYTADDEPGREEAILVSFLRSDGMYFVMLALSKDGVVVTLTSDDEGEIGLVGKNDNGEEREAVVICAVGRSVEEGIEAVMDYAKGIVRECLKPESSRDEKTDKGKIPQPQDKETFHDGLVYCTWNSLGSKLTSTTLSSALSDLKTSSIYPSTLIIDDGWQSIIPFGSSSFPPQHRLSRLEASAASFPEGLASLCQHIRSSYPWIKNIGIWHGIFGYWGGIEPDSEIGREYKLRWVAINNHHRSGIWIVDACDVRRFYDDFYSCVLALPFISNFSFTYHHIYSHPI